MAPRTTVAIMLHVQQLKFQRSDDVLFQDLDFVTYPGQRLAVVGRNGVGKTTLFNLILGKLSPSLGDIVFPADWRVGYMAQESEANNRPALDYVVDGHKALRRVEKAISETEEPNRLGNLYTEYEDLGGYQADSRAGEILYGLGFSKEEVGKPFKEFSGGWRIRLNLAKSLMAPSDLLLLDEPTNHLDLEAILWLEKWLKQYQGTLLFIAHDRAFLDSVSTHVLHLAGGAGKSYQGNYSTFERRRLEQLEQEQSLNSKKEAQARHIQLFVDRFRAKASKAKQVQSRIKALERMQGQALLHVDSDYRVSFNEPEKVSNPLITFRNLDVGYEDATILSQISQTILPGARIGVLGVNGAGKSTLLKALTGDLEPLSGRVERGLHSKIGYFAQHQLETLDIEDNALNTMQNTYPDLSTQESRDYLGGWGFDGSMINRPINSLSGGEKARFVLALLASDKPAMLVLDEPTNHLDLDMRDALALALQSYSGAVLIVAHDRDLLEKLVDEFWLVEGGQLRTYQSDLADYANLQEKNDRTESPEKDGSKRNQRQEKAKGRQSVNALKSGIKSLEQKMESQNKKLANIELKLADQETYQGLAPEELERLLTEAGTLRKQAETIGEDWLALSTQLEEREGSGV